MAKANRNVRKNPQNKQLIQDLKEAHDLFQNGCGWAADLSERISDFQSDFFSLVTSLEELQNTVATRQLEVNTADKCRKAMKRLGKYCRLMGRDDEPLTVLGIMQDCEQIEEHKQRFAKLLEDLNQK